MPSDPLSVFTYQFKANAKVRDCFGISFHTTFPDLEGLNFVHRELEQTELLQEATKGENRQIDCQLADITAFLSVFSTYLLTAGHRQ